MKRIALSIISILFAFISCYAVNNDLDSMNDQNYPQDEVSNVRLFQDNKLISQPDSIFSSRYNGTHWYGWAYLPELLFQDQTNFYYVDSADLSTPYFTDQYGSYCFTVAANHIPNAPANWYWQICYGSFEDPYRLSTKFNIPFEEDNQPYYKAPMPAEPSKWKRCFIYITCVKIDDLTKKNMYRRISEPLEDYPDWT